MEYGVVVNNKFALFDNEDEDPLEVLQRSQEQAVKKPATGKTAKDAKENNNTKVSAKNAKNTAVKDTKPATKQVAQPAKVLTPAQEQKPKSSSQSQLPRRENNTEKPPRFRQNENATQRERRLPKEGEQQQQRVDTDFRPEKSEPRVDREEFHGGRGGGFRRGRGGRGGRSDRNEEGGFDRFGKREFDRHSGSDRTGLKPIEKREGGGAHNWGTIADALAEQEQLAAKEATEQTVDTETPANVEEPAVEEVTEPEEKQLTLDEWKALQERNRAKASFNIRKAGEGVSAAPEWKKMFVLKKKVTEEHDEEEEEEEEEEDDARAKQKTQVPIQIKFNDSGSRGGFGRRGGGGGGGGRGGRGGGGPGRRQEGGDEHPRRGRSEKVDVVPNVDNEVDFPSLA